jgi:hypothetical protein
MDENSKEILIYFILLCASIIITFLMYFFYQSEQSLYFNIIKLISLIEISFLFSKFLSINVTQTFIADKIISKETLIALTSPIKFDYNYIEANLYLYQSTKSIYLFLNIMLCIETIKLIKRPFSHSKNQINIYILLSALIFIISIITQRYIEPHIYAYINDALYFIFIASGIISMIFVIIRFCLGRPLIQSAKNFFVMRHIVYILFLVGIFLNELSFINIKTVTRNTIVFCLGIIMSLVKISEKFYFCENNSSKKSKKKGASSMISSNLNVEFMCCILYGMTDIFMKNKNQSLNNIKTTREKTHTIKYLNTIDSKRNDIKSIVLEVSSEQDEKLINDKDEEKNQEGGIFNTGEDAFITEYFADKFDELRKNDGITDDIMIKSFSPIKNKSAIDKMGESKGRSGSFFFYSHDRKFIIKTITNEEKETMDKILVNYYNYMKSFNTTLITKIYGIYTVVIKNASSVNVILMQNLFGCSPIHIQRMFDLKGSSVQRKTKNVQKWKKDQVLKDMDYQWLTQVEPKLINFSNEDIQEIKKNMENDVNFLRRLSLMDYSLLFIIVDYPNKIDPDYKQIVGLLDDPKYKGHVYESFTKEFIYIIGIIDYLQIYNFRKNMETFAKGIYFGKEKNMISCVEPNYYGERFQDFMKKNVFVMETKY